MSSCIQCSTSNPRHTYAGCQVKRKLTLKKQANNVYQYDSDLYTPRPGEGGSWEFVTRIGSKNKVFKPQTSAVFGDAHLYWLHEGSVTLPLCSRACAVLYAGNSKMVLIHIPDLSSVFPEQGSYDEYAIVHGLASHISVMEQDTWTTPEQELEGLLRARCRNPASIVNLCSIILAKGKTQLAIRAVDQMLIDLPLHDAVQYSTVILAKLGDIKRIDKLYEQLASSVGGRERLQGEILSSWAFAISSGDRLKAKALSVEAVAKCPKVYTVIENHLMLLSLDDQEEACRFFYGHEGMVKSDVGFFAVGTAFLRLGHLLLAEDYLRKSENILADPMTKVYLAHTLYELDRFDDARELCQAGRTQVQTFSVSDGEQKDVETSTARGESFSFYPYRQKKALSKALLAIEGKCLIALGEADLGRSMVIDAIDMQLDGASEDVMYADLDKFADGYLSRSSLEKRLSEHEIAAEQNLSRARVAEVSSVRLRQVLDAISIVQSDWAQQLSALVDTAMVEPMADTFIDKIHDFCAGVKQADSDAYGIHVDILNRRYPLFTDNVIQQIATAEFLISQFEEMQLPIFAGVIIEYAKAVETCVNAVLVTPFVFDTQFGSTTIDLGNNARPVSLVEGSNVKALMLAQLSQVVSSKDSRWTQYANKTFGSQTAWTRYDLPTIITTVKNEYRNGSAHYSSPNRMKAIAMRDYLRKKEIFERLHAICTRQKWVATNAVHAAVITPGSTK